MQMLVLSTIAVKIRSSTTVRTVKLTKSLCQFELKHTRSNQLVVSWQLAGYCLINVQETPQVSYTYKYNVTKKFHIPIRYLNYFNICKCYSLNLLVHLHTAFTILTMNKENDNLGLSSSSNYVTNNCSNWVIFNCHWPVVFQF